MNKTTVVATASFALGAALTHKLASRKLAKTIKEHNSFWARTSKVDYESGVKFGMEMAKILLEDPNVIDVTVTPTENN